MNYNLFTTCCQACPHRDLEDTPGLRSNFMKQRLVCNAEEKDDKQTLAYISNISYQTDTYKADALPNPEFIAPESCPYKLEMLFDEERPKPWLSRLNVKFLRWLFK